MLLTARLLLFSFIFFPLFSCSKPEDELVNLEGELCFRNDYASQYIEIARVKPNGTAYRVLLHDTQTPGLLMGNEMTRWSFDKKKIVFNSARRGSSTGLRDVFIMNADGTDLVNVTNTPNRDEFAYGLSPDGQTLLFRMADTNGQSQLYLSGVNGSNLRALTNFTHATRNLNIGDAIWCGDGHTIIFTSNKDGAHNNIYSIQSDGTGLKRITTSEYGEYAPSVSKDGQVIAFVSNVNYQFHIYTIYADGTNKRLVTQSAIAFSPAISPDGRYIAYVGGKAKVNPEDGEDIYIIKADGTNLTRITRTLGSKYDLDWK